MRKIFILMLLSFTTFTWAQKLEIVSGNFDFLKDQSKINVKLEFDQVKLFNEMISEQDYLDQRKKAFVENPKRGQEFWDNWSKEWTNHREDLFLDKFILGTSKFKKISFQKNINSPYTLIVQTNWIYPGYHAGIGVEPAKLSSTLTFVETNNPEKTLLVIKLNKVKGTKGKNDYVMEYGRISAAYETSGRLLGAEIKKNIK